MAVGCLPLLGSPGREVRPEPITTSGLTAPGRVEKGQLPAAAHKARQVRVVAPFQREQLSLQAKHHRLPPALARTLDPHSPARGCPRRFRPSRTALCRSPDLPRLWSRGGRFLALESSGPRPFAVDGFDAGFGFEAAEVGSPAPLAAGPVRSFSGLTPLSGPPFAVRGTGPL